MELVGLWLLVVFRPFLGTGLEPRVLGSLDRFWAFRGFRGAGEVRGIEVGSCNSCKRCEKFVKDVIHWIR